MLSGQAAGGSSPSHGGRKKDLLHPQTLGASLQQPWRGSPPQLHLQALGGVLRSPNSLACRTLQPKKSRRRDLPSKAVVPIILSSLQKSADLKRIESLVIGLRELLSVRSVRVELVPALLAQNAWATLLPFLWRLTADEPLSALYYVLSVLGRKTHHLSSPVGSSETNCPDLSTLVTLALKSMRKYSKQPKVMHSILLFLKCLAIKGSSTMGILLESGFMLQLLQLLLGGTKKVSPNLTTLYALEALSAATRNKAAVTYLVNQGSLPLLLSFLSPGRWSSTGRKSPRMARLLKTLLLVLLHTAHIHVGRECLRECGAVPGLLCWADALPSCNVWHRHVLLASLVVQRCLPPLPLPLISLLHPTPYLYCQHSCSKDTVTSTDLVATPPSRRNSYREDPIEDNSSSEEEEEEDLSTDDDSTSGLGEPLPEATILSQEELSTYYRFFPEMGIVENGSSLSSQNTREAILRMAKESHCRELALEAQDWSSLYVSTSAQTLGLPGFLWVKDPLTQVGMGNNPFTRPAAVGPQPRYLQPQSLFRRKLLEHIGRRVQNPQINNWRLSQQTVFDLDLILASLSHSSNALRCRQTLLAQQRSGSLIFESRFESGNLRKAIQVGEHEYDLLLNPDVNTDGHQQWFYFRVSGMEAGINYTFNIVNCEKTSSLFNSGMQPVLYSMKSNQQLGCPSPGWLRAGTDISYYRNHYVRTDDVNAVLRDRPYFTLTFSIQFPYAQDTCYLAYYYPYTYTMLKSQLQWWQWSFDPGTIYFHQQELTKTLLGNPVHLLTITAKPFNSQRQYVFLTFRVHPGESNSSWIMKGVLDYLLSSKCGAQKLAQKYIFKIVPMLNPDGVLSGNQRCSLSGEDLNRQWLSPSPIRHPSIYHCKALVQFLHQKGKTPLVYCDFHGHSRRENVFLFGCNPAQSWRPSDWPPRRSIGNPPPTQKQHLRHQILPEILNQTAPAFSLENCCHLVEESKEATARVALWRQFNIALSYTLECTYSACNQGLYAGQQLGLPHLLEMGAKFCQALFKLPSKILEEAP